MFDEDIDVDTGNTTEYESADEQGLETKTPQDGVSKAEDGQISVTIPGHIADLSLGIEDLLDRVQLELWLENESEANLPIELEISEKIEAAVQHTVGRLFHWK